MHPASRNRLRLTNHGDVLLLGRDDQLPGLIFWNSFGDDGHRPDVGILHGLHGDVVSRPERGEVDDHVSLRVVLDGLADRRVD